MSHYCVAEQREKEQQGNLPIFTVCRWQQCKDAYRSTMINYRNHSMACCELQNGFLIACQNIESRLLYRIFFMLAHWTQCVSAARYFGNFERSQIASILEFHTELMNIKLIWSPLFRSTQTHKFSASLKLSTSSIDMILIF